MPSDDDAEMQGGPLLRILPDAPVEFPGDARNIEISERLMARVQIHENLDLDVITIQSDRLHRIARDHFDRLSKRLTPVSWGTFLTATSTLFAAEFEPRLGVSADVWQAGFVVLVIGSFAWTVVALVIRYKSPAPTAESLVEDAKGRPRGEG